jgi:hypothetical protein
MSWYEEAKKYAAMGAWVFPIRPGTKAPLTDRGVKDASNDLPLLRAWADSWPDAGIAIAGRDLEVGDILILEFDQKPTLSSWARELGQPTPHTRIHLSGGKRLPHFLFRQTEYSLRVGNVNGEGPYCEDAACPDNRKGGLHRHEWFSLRARNKYVLAPPSIHPDTGNPYTVFNDMDPQPIPDWLVDAILAKGTTEKQAAKNAGAYPVSANFDFDRLLAWMRVSVTAVSGAYHGLDICPVAGYKHTGSGELGCAIYWDGESLGFKCHAAECPSNTERKGKEGGMGCLMRLLQAPDKLGRYEGEIWPERETAADLASFGVEIEEAEKNPCMKAPDPAGVSKENQPAEKPAPKAWGAFPEDALYGYLGDLARRLECPLGYAYPALLAVYASRWSGLGTRTVRSNLYVLLLGETSAGKTRTQNRALATCVNHDPLPRVVDNALGSGEGLVQALGGKPDKEIAGVDRFGALPVLLHQDETREMFGKMAIDGSSLPYKLNRLYDHDDVGGSTKKGSITAFAKASLLGGLTVEGPAEFAEIFGRATVTGLYVRHIFGYHSGRWRFDDRWEEFERVKPEIKEPAQVKFGERAFDMKEEWEAASPKERGQRLSQLALRVAAITAAANGDTEVGEACMRAALRLMEWQQEIRSTYKPSRADSMGGRYSEMIMNEAWRHQDIEGNFLPFSWREAYRRNSWYTKDGSQVQKQRDILVGLGMLIKVEDPEHPKKILYRAANWSKEQRARGIEQAAELYTATSTDTSHK